MEYGWICFNDESVKLKIGNCKLAVIAVTLVLVILLTLVVASYSYATERLSVRYQDLSGDPPSLTQIPKEEEENGFTCKRSHA